MGDTPLPSKGARRPEDLLDQLNELAVKTERNFEHWDGQYRALADKYNKLRKVLLEYIDEQDLLVVEEHSHSGDATDGTSEGGQIDHANLGNVTPDQHHVQVHALDSTVDHSAATDNTNHDFDTTKHGLTPKSPGGTTQFLRADATWAVPPGGSGGGGGGGVYSTEIGNGSATEFVISHGLASLDVVVQVFVNATKQQIEVEVEHTSVDTVTVRTDGPPPLQNEWHATLIGGVAAAASSAWTQVVNEPGTSFANWTGLDGTWSSDGTVIKQTATTAGTFLDAYYSAAQVMSSILIFEAEIQIKSATAGNAIGGLTLGRSSANNNFAISARIDGTADQIMIDVEGGTSHKTIAQTINVDTWYKLRLVGGPNSISVYLDGTLVGSIRLAYGAGDTAMRDASFIGLYTYQSEVWFRNIKAWALTLPA